MDIRAHEASTVIMAYIPASMLPILLALLSWHILLSHASSHQGLAVARRGVLSVPDLSDAAERRHFALVRRQSAPDCGAQGGNRRCPNNLCCSDYGWCGDGSDYCDVRWCQAQFGRCGDAPPPEPTTTSTTSSSSSTTTRPPTTSTTSTSTSPPLPGGTMIISPNGLCGNTTTCAGSAFGDCCSEWYWCGNGPEYCAVGCRSAFGSCGGAISSSSTTTTTTTRTSSTSTSATPARPSDASRDGRCGEENGRQRCTGSDFGPCCSQFGWCGEGTEYCDVRTCQADWGICRGEGEGFM